LAKDLALYRRYLDAEGLDFRHFPSEQNRRVTYSYRGHLRLEVEAGQISIKTARRKLSAVIQLYKWLAQEGLFVPENSPWKAKRILISVDNDGRKPARRLVESTDIAFKIPNVTDITIVTDGGRLRPLSDEELDTLIKSLYSLQNAEMLLAHLVALSTGARIQTVLTLRQEDITSCRKGLNNCAYLPVGPGTGIDTKYGVSYTLVMDWFLIERLRIYISSERYKDRRYKSEGERFKGKEYLFLTNRGGPYFKSLQDPGYDLARYHGEGAAVRQFIQDRIRPILASHGKGFSYTFHDLRATFAMNLFNSLSERRELQPSQIREYLRFRLGHASHKALDSYTSFNELNKISMLAQESWEGRLRSFLSR
jgi:integrase